MFNKLTKKNIFIFIRKEKFNLQIRKKISE